MFYELLLWFILLLSVCSGLWTLQRHYHYFSEHTAKDLWQLRLDAWLYVANVWSTGWCVIDLFIHFTLCYSRNWEPNLEVKLGILWFYLHVGAALIATLIHLITNSLLSDPDIRRRCKRPRKPT